jgi:signal transduction histidine kinase
VQFYPNLESDRDRLTPGEKFPVLENFLIDAESFWQENETGKIQSGIWIEYNSAEQEFYLEASAVCLQERKILIITSNYQDRQLLIQKARENSLNYYNLVKEIQKKEILIHCIVHDLAGQLTGIKYCFELLSLQNLSPKALEYLEIGRKQCRKQEILIREILDAFSAEVESLDVFNLDPLQAPNVLVCAREVVNALSPIFSINQMNLQLESSIDESRECKVVGEKLRLERVLSNLVENAFRHSPPYSTVTIGINEEREFINITIDDEGSGIELEIASNLFQKFYQGKDKPGRTGLGLYFCRITVERWGGTIGCTNRPTGGAQFWFRLHKLSY